MALSASFFNTQSRNQLTRASHRFTDILDVIAFSLCPLKSWSTQLNLPAIGNPSSTHPRQKSIRLELDQWTSLGSGGFVWNGARRLAAHLQQHGTGDRTTGNYQSSWSGLNVIELGAGTGASGLAVAAMGANVTLTDQAAFVFPDSAKGGKDAAQLLGGESKSLLDLLRTNARLNQSLTQAPGQQDVQVHEMLWGSASHHEALPHSTFDVILASDVLLFERAQKELLSTLESLSTQNTVIIIEHTDRSGGNGEVYPGDMLRFLDLLYQSNSETIEEEDSLQWDPKIIKHHGRHITLRITRRSKDRSSIRETAERA